MAYIELLFPQISLQLTCIIVHGICMSPRPPYLYCVNKFVAPWSLVFLKHDRSLPKLLLEKNYLEKLYTNRINYHFLLLRCSVRMLFPR